MHPRMSLSPMLMVMAFVVAFSISRDPAISALMALLLAPFLHMAAGALVLSVWRRADTEGGASRGHSHRTSRHFVPCACCREPDHCRRCHG